MPYANNSGVRIFYEVEGAGPPLVMQHGSFANGRDWADFGYVDALKRDYQLILMDARGHGKSDKPHDPAAYDMALRVADVTAVLDYLGLKDAHFFGYSMGGWIGFGLAKYSPQRFRSLILGGAHPFAENIQGFREVLKNGTEPFMAFSRQIYGPAMNETMAARHANNDLTALLALSVDREDFSDVLPTMKMPCLLYVGEADPRLELVREAAKRIPNAGFFSLPELGHAAALVRSELVLPHITDFLRQLTREG
jgi:pimeloyl-ACP methyl ester carboxylesterase